MKFNRILLSLSSKITPPQLRNYLLNKLLTKVSQDAEIRYGVHFEGSRIVIEEKAFINRFCRLFSHDNEGGEIYIGKNAVLAMGVTLTTHTHTIGDSNRRAPRNTVLKPIRIEEGCWLGANVTVLPGVTIGKGTVVGAGSVVVRDLEPNSLYVGNPARKVKDLNI